MSESKETLQRFKSEAVRALSPDTLRGGVKLSLAEAEVIVEELASLVLPFIASTVQSTEAARLANEGMLAAQNELVLERLRRESQVADQVEINAKQAARLQEQKATELRARLMVAELNEELRKAGFEHPLGIEGVRDAMDSLKRYHRWSDAYGDFLHRIADVVKPENRASHFAVRKTWEGALQAVEQVTEIIEEFDEYER